MNSGHWRNTQRNFCPKVAGGNGTAATLAAQKLGIALARALASDEIVRVLGLQYCDILQDVRGLQRHYILPPGGGALARQLVLLKDWRLASWA